MAERWILQFCHCHYGPFLDVARQYAVLFDETPFKVLTVYLTGEPDQSAIEGSASDEVIFLNFGSKAVRGLKLGAIRALKTIIASREFELVIAHRFKPIYVACLATRLPIIGVHHAFGDYKRVSRRWFVNLFRNRVSLLGVSNAVRDDIRKQLREWPPNRIETLYNRICVEEIRNRLIHRPLARQMLRLPADATIIGNVGRLHPDKDQATLIAAFASALPTLPPNTLLAIAGSGPLENSLRTQANSLGVSGKVVFLGQVPEARRYFSAFDLFVLSSDHEPFGMVLLEAIAAGVPILATDCGGAPEVVGRADLLFTEKKPESLAKKLEWFFCETTDNDKATLVEFLSERLSALFSDIAARQRFASLINQILMSAGR